MPFPKTEKELEDQGYQFCGTSKCSGPRCGAEVAWYRTPKGRRIPLNVGTGTLEPHFKTCPDAEEFRR